MDFGSCNHIRSLLGNIPASEGDKKVFKGRESDKNKKEKADAQESRIRGEEKNQKFSKISIC